MGDSIGSFSSPHVSVLDKDTLYCDPWAKRLRWILMQTGWRQTTMNQGCLYSTNQGRCRKGNPKDSKQTKKYKKAQEAA